MMDMPFSTVILLVVAALIIIVGVILMRFLGVIVRSGAVSIEEDKVGIVIKRFSILKKTSPHSPVALKGETGIQVDTLGPGFHWRWPRMYKVLKQEVIRVRPDEIALVSARNGAPRERQLAKSVWCNDFQDARAFFENGGQVGKQIDILTTGEYRINTELFDIITRDNAHQHGVDPAVLCVYNVNIDKVGIVTTFDGAPLDPDQYAAPSITGHNFFQDGQAFIDGGGCSGLQEHILPPGLYNLNPWFVHVEQVDLVQIRPGTVGVKISNAGQRPNDQASEEPVDLGYRGVLKDCLTPGEHRINTRIMRIEIVPTHDIMLKWSDTQEASSDKHIQLPALRVRSADGFEVSVELAQSIKIPPEQAPKMISRLGFGNPDKQAGISGGDANLNRSIRNLIAAVGPQIDNHFRNATQSYKARDLQKQRDELCIDANQHITEALGRYGVNSVGTWINHIDLPDELEKEMKERTIKEEQATTLRIQQEAEEERRKYAESQARAESALARIHAETEAEAARIAADAQAYAARQQADVDDYALQQYISAIGGSAIYTDIQRISYLTNIRLPPLVGGGAGVLSDIFTQLLAIGQGSAQHSLPPIPRNLLEMLAVKRSDDSRLAYIKRSLPENLDMNDPDTRQFITDFLQPAAVPTCAACGAEHRPEAGFCAQCGATLAR